MRDLVTVVDENDKELATKPRSKLTSKDIVRVSVLWVEDGKGNVLLQQRALTKKIGPGLWGPAVAGTVESHETYLSNIVKEAEEEIGLTDFEPQEVDKRLFWEKQGEFGRMFTFYQTTIDQPVEKFKLKTDEVAQIKWVPKEQLLANLDEHISEYVPSAVFWKEIYG
ncbi:NUDIX domain-containing protein [Candidatus Saccharibacteria bacterium]|nr:NUDIX domain-containing protein [Candidatus Saccharibacteria bacterium]